MLAKGDKWPNAALGAIYKLPKDLDGATLALVKDLDKKLVGLQGDSIQRLQVGLIAVLARSGDTDSMDYLRKIWEESPDRRQAATLGLAQQPEGENWELLIRSLPSLDAAAARQVCLKLMDVETAPETPETFRQVIILGLKMRAKDPELKVSAEPALALLQYWTGEELAVDEPEELQLAAWQKWFAGKYPDQLEAKLPAAAENARYSFDELAAYLTGEEAKGSPTRGSDVYFKAQCAKCHRFDSHGESFGPELTAVASRFTKKELLESVMFPSHVISSQYASKTVLTKNGQQITGLVVPGAAGEVVIMQPNGEKVVLTPADIEQEKPSKLSSMPNGLLDLLSLEEIADLFAFLQKPKPGGTLTRRPLETAPNRARGAGASPAWIAITGNS